MPSRRSYRIEFPPELPISARAGEIVDAIQANPVLILAGETGSGKSTQIPKLCLAAGRGTRGRIACTQPRRVAAISVSRRVAEEMGVPWGREVGCKIRFQDRTSSATVVKFVTDGMLLSEVQGDPLLREYDTIIVDEAHERSLNIDFLLGHLRQLCHRRPDLRVIVTSATIDTEAFSRAFDDAPVIVVEGRTYPVEVVYAPLDELGSDYDESSDPDPDVGSHRSARAEALHYIDGAVEAVGRILKSGDPGDVLVFMPSERDIRETAALLEGQARAGAKSRMPAPEIVPLFGRLTNAEQQRVFATTQARKIVVATNIAETSLTIPGIRFVVDTGLARVSRYAPQARTRRLPIEPVSQSSADQRKGRSGRVEAGVCIRLYSEKDYLERPRFTQPEIQRANLADVILRLKAFGLGDIERFPFINMPSAKAIRAGYALLEELGALARADGGERSHAPPPSASSLLTPTSDSPTNRQLTSVGQELARLPVDPTVGRMILEAQREQALAEVLVIASGLSIQDPRERPLDRQTQADAAHRRFAHPESDFLTLLAIWESTHGDLETMSQSRLRRFCRDHFLSFTRMREWRDIHGQLLETLAERKGFRLTSAFEKIDRKDPGSSAFGSPAYRAIHRSILAGLLGNIARRGDEDAGFVATHERKVSLFPGSVLFVREEPRRKGARPTRKTQARGPRWLLAAEIVETSRLYARTCARLDPAWVLDLGAHLMKVSHSEPFWDPEKGRVLVRQRSRLYGLELETRAVGYGRVDPLHATELFIRDALVNDEIERPLEFLEHNRRIRAEVGDALTRARDRRGMNLDEATYRFYAARLLPRSAPVAERASVSADSRPRSPEAERVPTEPISSIAELANLVRRRVATEPDFLKMRAEDLMPADAAEADASAFPKSVDLENRVLSLAYAYRPGLQEDGVTLDIPVRDVPTLTQSTLDWAVPGHLNAKVEHLLRSLPKELRRAFVPIGETAKTVAASLASRDRLTGRRESLAEALAAELRERFGISIQASAWADRPLPDHLRVRIRVLDRDGRELCSGRELEAIQDTIRQITEVGGGAPSEADDAIWTQARKRWEKPDQTSWTFGDLPTRIEIGDRAGVPIIAWPGLRAGTAGVALRLFRSEEEAARSTAAGISALLELQLRHDIAWLERDLRDLRAIGFDLATLAAPAQVQADALESIRTWVTDPGRVARGKVPHEPEAAIIAAASFEAALAAAKADLRGIVPRLTDLLREILGLRRTLLQDPHPFPGMDTDLAALLPSNFLRTTPFAQLTHLPRYLKAMQIRAGRRKRNPDKDAERARQLKPFADALNQLLKEADSPRGSSAISPPPSATALRWLVEEFRVSLFAQELGTAEPVSAARLKRAIADARDASTAPTKATPPPKAAPTVTAQRVDKSGKSAPLKNLSALDRLFKS